MKKIQIIRLCLISALFSTMIFFLNGCQKEKELFLEPTTKSSDRNSTNEFNVSVVNNLLVFKTTEDYERLISSEDERIKGEFVNYINTQTNFVSLSATDAVSEIPEFLKSILNTKSAIQIGDKIYKIDLENESVYVFDARYADQIDYVGNGGDCSFVTVYSTEDDVIEMVTTGIAGSDLKCNDRRAKRKKDEGMAYYGAGSYYRLDCKVVYQAVGIYFSLEYKVKNQSKIGGAWVACYGNLWATYSASWKPRCRSSQSSSNNCTTCYANTNVFSKRLYESTRALKNYTLSARFINRTSPQTITRYFTISDY